jgi:hypothetical protein
MIRKLTSESCRGKISELNSCGSNLKSVTTKFE